MLFDQSEDFEAVRYKSGENEMANENPPFRYTVVFPKRISYLQHHLLGGFNGIQWIILRPRKDKSVIFTAILKIGQIDIHHPFQEF